MFKYIIGFNRSECSESDVKCYITYINAFCLNLFKQFGCKVKSCRRCRRTARIFCIHCLVSVFIFKFMCYIVRQRHFSEFIQNLLKYSLILKLNKSVTVIYNVQNLRFKLTVAKNKSCAGFSFSARFQNHFPSIKRMLMQKQKFNSTARILFLTVQTCRKYLCIIQYKCITFI